MKNKKLLIIILLVLALVGSVVSIFVIPKAATEYQIYYGDPDNYNSSGYDSVGYVKYESEYFKFPTSSGNEYNYVVFKNSNTALPTYCSEGGKLFGNKNNHLMFVGKSNILAFMDGSSGELEDLDPDFLNWKNSGKTYFEAHLKTGYTLSDYLDGMSVILQYANHHYNWHGLSDDALHCATSVAFHAFPQLFFNLIETGGSAPDGTGPGTNLGRGHLSNNEYASEFPGIHVDNRVSIDTAGNLTTSWHAENSSMSAADVQALDDFTKNLIKLAFYNVPIQASMNFAGTTSTPEISTKVINMKESGSNYIADIELTVENLPNGKTIGTPSVTLNGNAIGSISVLSGPTTTEVKETYPKYYVPKMVTKVTYRVTIPKANNAEKTFDVKLTIDGFLDKDSDLIYLANTRSNVGGNAWSGIRLYQAMYAFDVGSVSLSDTIKLQTPPDVHETYVYVEKSVPAGYNAAGATFGIYKDSGCTVSLGTVSVDSTGKSSKLKITLQGNETSKTVYAKELSGPTQSGNFTWKLENGIKSVTLTAANTESNPAKFSFVNTVQEYGYAQVKKTVPSGYQPTGAEYTIYTDAACTQAASASYFASGRIEKFVITANGLSNSIKFNVPTGSSLTLYTKETRVPTSNGDYTWKIDPGKYAIKVSKTNTATNVYTVNSKDEVQEYGYVIVHKDVPTGYRPTGAEYTIYTDANCQTPANSSYFANNTVQKFVITSTGDSNKIKFNAPTNGSIKLYVKETKKPTQTEEGFIWKIDERIFEITIAKQYTDNQPFRVSSKNTTTEYGYGYVTKVSDVVSKQALVDGAEFTVYKPDGSIAKDFMTGQNVVLVVENGKTGTFCLEVGTYTIKETKVPSEFDKADDRQITITKNNTTRINITNHYRRFEVYAIKTTDREDMLNKYPLTGTKIGVYTDQACTTLAIDILTGDQCILTVNSNLTSNKVTLGLGKYYFKEISTTQWYTLSDEIIERVMNEDGKTYSVTYDNSLKPGLGQVEKGFKNP